MEIVEEKVSDMGCSKLQIALWKLLINKHKTLLSGESSQDLGLSGSLRHIVILSKECGTGRASRLGAQIMQSV